MLGQPRLPSDLSSSPGQSNVCRAACGALWLYLSLILAAVVVYLVSQHGRHEQPPEHLFDAEQYLMVVQAMQEVDRDHAKIAVKSALSQTPATTQTDSQTGSDTANIATTQPPNQQPVTTSAAEVQKIVQQAVQQAVQASIMSADPGPTNVSLPHTFDGLQPDNPIESDLLPQNIDTIYPGKAPTDAVVFPLHWVICTCQRHQWGRMLTTTLLSGLFNGLKPTTISIVWCKRYNDGEHPSLLYNLRHSHHLNVFFLSERIARAHMSTTEKSYITALSVPTALGMEHLPLLITEDDVFLAPDANARLKVGYDHFKGSINDDPWTLWLYYSSSIKPAPNTQAGIAQQPDDQGVTHNYMDGITLLDFIEFGSQGMVHSPGMTKILLRELLKAVNRSSLPTSLPLQDHMVRGTLTNWHCNVNAPCHFYTLHPSLVQHIGTSSALFNVDGIGQNQRWHAANMFPVRVGMPGYDQNGTW